MKRSLVAMALALAGCGGGQPDRALAFSSSGQALEFALPTSELVFTVSGARFLSLDLIGRGLNGTAFSGKVLDDRALARVLLSDVVLPSGRHARLRLKGSAFGGAPTVVGAVFTGQLDDGEALPLRVDDAVAGTAASDLDVVRYAVSFQATQGWLPLCGLTAGGEPVRAIPLAGTWDLRQGVPGGGAWSDDHDAFTFACEGFVLAKCVDMGYAPWREGRSCPASATGHAGCSQKISLAPYHRACARMLRADYCGDGASHTEDGTAVNSYDLVGVRHDSEPWAAEAEWTEDGATCLARLREPSAPAPACAGRLASTTCGLPGHVASSTLVVSELSP